MNLLPLIAQDLGRRAGGMADAALAAAMPAFVAANGQVGPGEGDLRCG